MNKNIILGCPPTLRIIATKRNQQQAVKVGDLPRYAIMRERERARERERERERERNVLFNDALNTFYLRLYGVRHMVKDHSDSEKGNPLPPHRLLLSINSKGSFICTIPPVVEHWLEREIARNY